MQREKCHTIWQKLCMLNLTAFGGITSKTQKLTENDGREVFSFS
jgi:hypothetical protein